MKYRLKMGVSLKLGHSDPEGDTTAKLLRELGYSVEAVSVSKGYSVVLTAASRSEAKQKADEMCRRLLANPTKDDYVVTVEEEK